MGRIDHGCSKKFSLGVNCTGNSSQGESYGVGTAQNPGDALLYIDTSYDPTTNGAVYDTPQPLPLTPCANATDGVVGTYPNFQHGSVVSDDYLNPTYPNTFVNFVFGSADTSAAPPQATEWYDAILVKNPSQPAPACVSGAPHELPGYYQGAAQIANDLIDDCKLQ
jgi:hypothetical protein